MSNIANDRISIVAVGDIMLGDSPKMLGIGVRGSINKIGASHLFNDAKTHLRGDIVFGNLETVLSDIGYNPKKFHLAQLRGPALAVSSLCDAGFNVLNIANNHMMQYGTTPFLETCSMLETRGVALVGLRGESEWFSQPAFVTKKGVTVGFLGYADPDNYGHHPLFSINKINDILSDVERLKPQVDVVVVSLHWGSEFVRCPSPVQQEHASEIIASGADIILGHHPHVIQPIEFIGESIVCYSLGNFISDMIWNDRTREGLSVMFCIDKNGVKLKQIRKIEIDQKYCPRFIEYDLEKINKHVVEDQECIALFGNYGHYVHGLIRENRNCSHFFLLKKVLSYNLGVYMQIWVNSIISFLKKL